MFFGGDTSLHRFTFHWKCVQRCCHLSALDFLRMRPVIVFLSVNLGGMLGWMNWNLVFGIPYFSLWDQEVMGTSSRKHRFHWDRTGTYDKQTRLAWKHPKFNWNDQMYMKLRGIKTTQLIFSYQLLVYQRLISDKEGVWGLVHWWFRHPGCPLWYLRAPVLSPVAGLVKDPPSNRRRKVD